MKTSKFKKTLKSDPDFLTQNLNLSAAYGFTESKIIKDKMPPVDWRFVTWFDSDYEEDVSEWIPYDEDGDNVIVTHLLSKEEFELSPIAAGAYSNIMFAGIAGEKAMQDCDEELGRRANTLYHNMRSLVYSSDAVSEEDRRNFFKLTD